MAMDKEDANSQPSKARRAARQNRPRVLPSSRRGRNTFERIFEATTELAAELGFEGVNTNLVASRAGVNIASLYRYFPNKQAIFAAISERLTAAFKAEISGLVAQIDAGRPWTEAVADGMRLAATRRLNSPGARSIRIAIRLSPELQELDAAETRVVSAMLADLMMRRSGADPERAMLAARVAIEMAAAILDLLLSEPASDADALASEASDAFIRYLTPLMENPVSAEPPARSA
jgi:AcrR family transcriptional regulator